MGCGVVGEWEEFVKKEEVRIVVREQEEDWSDMVDGGETVIASRPCMGFK